jgi:hypothetical protein
MAHGMMRWAYIFRPGTASQRSSALDNHAAPVESKTPERPIKLQTSCDWGKMKLASVMKESSHWPSCIASSASLIDEMP